ncbi:Patellin-4 [Folsomia candida]|uniref:Patellin-4 n=1 Tax=Folsomia candida TaxID=158441 RepID=A0A226D3C7_FOLCA|nr:Patellin-4 [Folsomia candida]
MVAILVIMVICVSTCVPNSQGTLADDDLTLSVDQKVKLDEFNAIMSSRVPHEYMKSEIYLVPWLRVNDFNVDAATRALVTNFIWRDENKIDSILDEDWTEFNKDYRVNVEGCDMEGKPGIPFLVHILEDSARNPLMFTRFIFLNIPQYAVAVWNNIVGPLAPPGVADLVELHGTNKEAWRDILLKKHGIDVSKLSPDFGGDGPDSVDLETIKKNGHNYQCPK